MVCEREYPSKNLQFDYEKKRETKGKKRRDGEEEALKLDAKTHQNKKENLCDVTVCRILAPCLLIPIYFSWIIVHSKYM